MKESRSTLFRRRILGDANLEDTRLQLELGEQIGKFLSHCSLVQQKLVVIDLYFEKTLRDVVTKADPKYRFEAKLNLKVMAVTAMELAVELVRGDFGV